MSEIVIKGKAYKTERTYPFRIVACADFHVGGQYGLWPEDWMDHYGTSHRANPGQMTLLKYFLEELPKEANEIKANILMVVGDLLSGQNPKEKGKYSMHIELPEQKKACAYLIAEFCKKVPSIEEVWFWKGTGYHGSIDTSIEEDIVNKLRAEYSINAKYHGEYSWLTLEYESYKKTMFVAHSASQAYMYPEQAMGRDMMMFQEAYAQEKLPKVHVVIRAHKHFFKEVHDPYIRSIQLPCWQFFVPYDNAVKNYAKFQPDIGAALILFDNKLRMTVWHFIYPNIIEPERLVNVKLGKYKFGKKTDKGEKLVG